MIRHGLYGTLLVKKRTLLSLSYFPLTSIEYSKVVLRQSYREASNQHILPPCDYFICNVKKSPSILRLFLIAYDFDS